METLNGLILNTDVACDSIDSNFAYAIAYLNDGDIDSAIEALYRHIENYNNIISSHRDEALFNVQHQYDLEIANELKQKNLSYRYSLIICCLFLAIVLILGVSTIIFLRNRHKTKQLEQERNILIIKQEYNAIKSHLELAETKVNESQSHIKSLELELYDIYSKNYEETIHGQKHTIESLNNEVLSLRQYAYQSFLNQFAWVDRFYTLYNKSTGSKDKEKELTALVSKEINELFTNGKFLATLTGLITQYDQSIIEDIENLQLITSEKEVILYSICGFSTSLIAILTKKSQRAIYNLRSRIKEKLINIGSPGALRIREFLASH